MKRKLIAAGLALVFAVSFTACGSGAKSMSYGDYDLDEYLETGEYTGLTVAPYAVAVSDDEVDAEIRNVLKAAAKSEGLTEKDEIKKGDTVNIDYEGKIGGKAFDGGSAQGTDLNIGSGTFIDGFEDGLVGRKIGETAELELTFPKDYSSEELAGKDVVFTVKINSAKRTITPSVEKYVKDSEDYDSVEALKKATKKKLKNQKEETAIKDQKQSLWSDALDRTKVNTYPEREVAAYKELNSRQIDTYAENYGVTREEMLKQYGFETEEDFENVNEDSSKLRVKQEMLLEWMAAHELISYTDEEADAMLQQMEQGGYDEDAIAEQTGRNAKDYVRIEMLYEKALDYLLDNAKISGPAKEY